MSQCYFTSQIIKIICNLPHQSILLHESLASSIIYVPVTFYFTSPYIFLYIYYVVYIYFVSQFDFTSHVTSNLQNLRPNSILPHKSLKIYDLPHNSILLHKSLASFIIYVPNRFYLTSNLRPNTILLHKMQTPIVKEADKNECKPGHRTRTLEYSDVTQAVGLRTCVKNLGRRSPADSSNLPKKFGESSPAERFEFQPPVCFVE